MRQSLLIGGVDAAIIYLSFSSISWEQKLILLTTASALSLFTLKVARLR